MKTVNITKGVVYLFEDSACLACLDLNDEIIFVRQKRKVKSHLTIELPGGNVIADETASEAAIREFEEETLLPRPDKADFLFTLDLDLSTSVHRTHVFRAKINARVKEISHGSEIFAISFVEALAMVKRGEITHAPTVAAILSMGVI